MSNSRHNKSSISGKRSSFLPPDVMKEFGCYIKKPRLDIRLTPLSQRSPNKSPVSTNNKDSVDEIWGEDLPEDVVEECVMLATQACQEDSIIRSEISTLPKNSNEGNYENASTSKNSNGIYKPPIQSFRLSRKGSSSFVFQQKKEVANPHPVRKDLFETTNVSNTSNKTTSLNKKHENSDMCLERDRHFENENKELKEKCLQKEGEVAILRAQLKKLELQIKSQTLDHRKSLEAQAEKYSKQIKDHKKELDVTNTQLQFQIMEATSIRNHCRVLESGSKIKLIEPQQSKPVTPKRKEEEEKHLYKSSSKRSPVTRSTRNNLHSNQIVKYSRPNQIFSIREGSVLGQLVNEYLTVKSQPDNSWILYLRKKQGLCRKIKEAEDINKKILTLEKNHVTLENCYAAINKLITLNAVSSTSAYFHVESIVRECQRIICRQMHILCLISAVQSFTERGNLNGVVSSIIGKPVGSNCELMVSKKWYEEEEGIESRRALGLLCGLCSVSSLASELTYGSQNLSMSSNITEIFGLNLDIATTSKKLHTAGINEKLGIAALESQKNDELPYNEYLTKPFGFLQLLRDIVFSICYQRRTKHFIGFLTGSLKLLSAIGRNIKLEDGGLKLVSEIIREVVFCRPQVEVTIALFELLSILATYPVVMRSLCINSDGKTFVDNRDIGLAYFTRESCVTQVLFRLLPVSATTVQLRTGLCYHMVHWLYSMICFSGKEQCWLLSIQENRKANCYCRSSIASGLVTTLYNSLCDLDIPNLNNEIKWKLYETFKKSIILMRVLQEDKTSWAFLNRHNFAYQLWLARIEMDIPKLNLSTLERECVKELLDRPENENDANSGVENEDSEYWNIISNDCKTMLADER